MIIADAGTAQPVLVKVVYFGDSITFGQYVDPEYAWVAIVSERLQQQFLHTPVNILQLKRAVSGETTRQALERFPADVQVHQPDVLTIQFGLNDCNCWLTDNGHPRVSEAAFDANLREMIARARLSGVSHIILSNNHPTTRLKVMLNGARYEDANAGYSEIAGRVAQDTGVTFCDIRSQFLSNANQPLEELLLPYPDQLHLSAAGNALYADAIWPSVQRAVSEVVYERSRGLNYGPRKDQH